MLFKLSPYQSINRDIDRQLSAAKRRPMVVKLSVASPNEIVDDPFPWRTLVVGVLVSGAIWVAIGLLIVSLL